MAQALQDLEAVTRGAGLWAEAWADPRWAQYSPPPGPPAVVRYGTFELSNPYV